MFLSKTKMFLATGLLLAVMLTVAGAASADWDGRLFKPYQPEQFGGSRRGTDGVYGSVEMLYWKMDGPRNVAQFDMAMNLSEIPSDFQLGTRITFGNQSGHHGWRFTGYGVSGLGGSVVQTGITGYTSGNLTSVFCTNEDHIVPIVAPLGHEYFVDWINFVEGGRLVYRSQARIIDLDLAWTYRTHPFKWGELEFFAGAKYRDINDKLSFVNEADRYAYTFRYTLENCSDAGTMNRTLAYTNSVNAHSITQEATNRMAGPNLGFNLTRRNLRWTFGAGASVFLGVNTQSFKFNEYYEERTSVGDNDSPYADLSLEELINYRSTPSTGRGNGPTPVATVLYKQHRTVFSPGVNLQLSAKWQWTDAVGIRVGFDSTIMDNVARSSDLVATPNADAGYDFSLRSKGDVVLLYGISIGFDIRR